MFPWLLLVRSAKQSAFAPLRSATLDFTHNDQLGPITVAMMFVRTTPTFYLLRFLLGTAEAGFFPGMIYYLSEWYPEAQRARAIAALMTAVPVSGLIGGPLSGALLQLNGRFGRGRISRPNNHWRAEGQVRHAWPRVHAVRRVWNHRRVARLPPPASSNVEAGNNE